MELTHQDIQELLGVYALDAVDPDEADLIEVHLRECPRCRAEVVAHRETAAVLAHSGSSAPPGVWERIAGNLEEAPPQLDLAKVVALKPRRRSIPLPIAAAVAAMAAAVIAVLGVQVDHLDDRTDGLEAALGSKGLDQAVQVALFDESARRVDLRSTDGVTLAQAVVRENGEAYFVPQALPALSAEETYQLWAIIDDQAVSVGVLGSHPGVSAFKVAGSGVTLLAVTTEEAGGVISSKKTPVMMGTLPVV